MHSPSIKETSDTRDHQVLSDSALFYKCLAFVQEQSDGVWSEAVENEDAKKLAKLLENETVHLRVALLQWKCSSCGGSRIYRWQDKSVPCKLCKGTGLHPIAREALEI